MYCFLYPEQPSFSLLHFSILSFFKVFLKSYLFNELLPCNFHNTFYFSWMSFCLLCSYLLLPNITPKSSNKMTKMFIISFTIYKFIWVRNSEVATGSVPGSVRELKLGSPLKDWLPQWLPNTAGQPMLYVGKRPHSFCMTFLQDCLNVFPHATAFLQSKWFRKEQGGTCRILYD